MIAVLVLFVAWKKKGKWLTFIDSNGIFVFSPIYTFGSTVANFCYFFK
jgi:hypothetical protein